jgi:hypothetical protein
MIEPLTAVTWAFSVGTAIANSEPGKKFIEASIGAVAEKLTNDGMTKIGQLRNLIAEKLRRDKPEALPAWDRAEQGSVEDLHEVAGYLMMLQKDSTFTKAVNDLVQEIKSCVVQGDNAMVQNNYDQARGYQLKAEAGSKVYFVEKMENPD